MLDPVERLSEILFGLIMAMTFTGAIRAAQAEREDLREILIGAIGCNLAWGIVDAVMYVMTELVGRGHVKRSLRALRQARTADDVRDAIDDVLPDSAIAAMKPGDYEALRRWIESVPPDAHRSMTARTWKGAFYVFLLVTLSTFPVVIPLLLFRDDAQFALRASHGVAVAMLFGIGSALGKRAGMKPWITGVSLALIGVLLAGLTILLGG